MTEINPVDTMEKAIKEIDRLRRENEAQARVVEAAGAVSAGWSCNSSEAGTLFDRLDDAITALREGEKPS